MQSLVLSLAAASLLDVAFAATSGNFNVLTMNVAGLPAILQGNDVPGDKTVNSGLMGTYFAEYDYDVINVQEVSQLCDMLNSNETRA
jgi:hypothetical protein